MGALEPKPYLVSWNLTRRCNLLCPHCYVNSVKTSDGPETGELNTDEARLVIDELSYLNDKLMLVLSGGEPMVREDIYEIVEYAARADFIPVLGSNGTLLTHDSLKNLKQAGLMGVGISVDSITPEKHDSFRGLQGAWELSVGALESAKAVGLETQIDVTITDNNIDEIDSFVELAKKLRARAVNFFFLVCTGRAMKIQISTDNYDKALKRIADIFLKEKDLMVRARCAPHIYRVLYERGYPVPVGTRGCMAGRSYLRIDPIGNITPCPYMDVSLGNVRDVSLSTLWQEAPELIALRTGGYKGRCGSCEYVDICGGCRARSFAENGDMLGEDSLCEYKPEGSEPVQLKDSFSSDLEWEDDARKRIERVPLFMKGMIIRVIEENAKQKGIKLITTELIDKLKKKGYSHMR